MVEYRGPAREIVTVQLDEAGGRRPAMPSPLPHPLSNGALPACGPYGRSTYTASQAGGSQPPAL